MAANNDASVRFKAETQEFDNAIKESKSTLQTLNAELRLNEAQFKNNGDAVEYNERRQDLLKQKLEANAREQEALRDKIELATNAFGDDSAEVEKLERQLLGVQTQEQYLEAQLSSTTTELQAQIDAANNAESASQSLSDEISSQQTELDALKQAYVDVALEMGTDSTEAQMLGAQIEELSGNLSSNQAELAAAEAAANSFDQSMTEMSDTGSGLSSVSGGAFGDVASSIMQGGIAGLVSGITDNLGELINMAIEMPIPGMSLWAS